MADVIDVQGLRSLTRDGNIWSGWIWITEVDHPDVIPIHLAMGAHRAPLGGQASIHLPIHEVQVNCYLGSDGTQGFDMVAVHDGAVPPVEETDGEDLEIMIQEFLLARFEEAK